MFVSLNKLARERKVEIMIFFYLLSQWIENLWVTSVFTAGARWCWPLADWRLVTRANSSTAFSPPSSYVTAVGKPLLSSSRRRTRPRTLWGLCSDRSFTGPDSQDTPSSEVRSWLWCRCHLLYFIVRSRELLHPEAEAGGRRGGQVRPGQRRQTEASVNHRGSGSGGKCRYRNV